MKFKIEKEVTLKFFLDTANIDEIKKVSEWGLIDGVTTNPTLLSKEIKRTGEKPFDILKEICETVKGPVSAEVTSLEFNEAVKQAEKLREISKWITIKSPATIEGIKIAGELVKRNIPVNMTLIFSANQAILAARVGATFASPFIGRLDDIGKDGMNLVYEMVTIYNNYGFDTEVLVSSIRHPQHIVEAALLGAGIATIPFEVIEKMSKHPLTDYGIERFEKDWEEVKGSWF